MRGVVLAFAGAVGLTMSTVSEAAPAGSGAGVQASPAGSISGAQGAQPRARNLPALTGQTTGPGTGGWLIDPTTLAKPKFGKLDPRASQTGEGSSTGPLFVPTDTPTTPGTIRPLTRCPGKKTWVYSETLSKWLCL